MKSPFGRRGSICARDGWTGDYLHHDIAWGIVERMLIDAPNIEEEGEESEEIKLPSENADKGLEMINNINR